MILMRVWLGFVLVAAVVASGYEAKRRRDLRRAEQALMKEMEKELQTAYDMQMGLRPADADKPRG